MYWTLSSLNILGFFLSLLCHASITAFDVEAFHEKLLRPTPSWMKEQIEKDLAPFEKELSREYLDGLFTKDRLVLVRVKVADGLLSIQKSRDAAYDPVPNDIIPHIEALHRIKPLPDVDFIFSGLDVLPSYVPWPIFVITKIVPAKGLILFPDWYALKDFQPNKALVLEGNDLYPWESKIELLFFRGADSGVDPNNWKNSPRPRFVSLSLQYPDLIDARFALNLHHRHMLAMAEREGYIGDFVSMRDHPKYKYLMDIDGNCAPTPRFPLMLHSNSVIFKSMTNSVLWFYGTIKPYVHFIPVAEDFSDIFTQLEWAKTHDEQCKEISENARQLATEVLSQETNYLYLYRLLEEYSKKQACYYNQ